MTERLNEKAAETSPGEPATVAAAPVGPSVAMGPGGRAAGMLWLQRAVGNRATGRVLQRYTARARSTVDPGDVVEVRVASTDGAKADAKWSRRYTVTPHGTIRFDDGTTRFEVPVSARSLSGA